MPVVAFQIFALEVYDAFFGLLKSVSPVLAEQLPPDKAAVLTPTSTAQLMRTLKDFFQKDPLLAESLLVQLSHANTLPLEARKYQLLKSLIGMYQSPKSPYLNFYGPRGTIPTIPYHQILALEGQDPLVEQQRLALHGKAVFVGLTEPIRSSQKDDFHTAFSQQSGANITGVEIAATAFANLVEGLPIRSVSWGGHLHHTAVGPCWALCVVSSPQGLRQ